MTALPNRFIITAFTAVFALGIWNAWAEKAPLSPEDRTKEASHIVSGTVVKVTSKTQKSTVEKAAGIHRDRVFSITVQVVTVLKGTGIQAGDQIQVVAWHPSSRIPPLPGSQGHESIPKKGDTATFYLEAEKGKRFEPLLPNGISIKK